MRKLTMDDARQIRLLHQTGEVKLHELSKQFGCSISTIFSVVRNFTHFDRTYKPCQKTPFDVEFAKTLQKSGKTILEICSLEAKHSRRSKPYSPSSIQKKLQTMKRRG